MRCSPMPTNSECVLTLSWERLSLPARSTEHYDVVWEVDCASIVVKEGDVDIGWLLCMSF